MDEEGKLKGVVDEMNRVMIHWQARAAFDNLKEYKWRPLRIDEKEKEWWEAAYQRIQQRYPNKTREVDTTLKREDFL